MRGKIIKGIAGFYYVKSGENVYRCRARGIFKERGIKPAAGDEVVIELGEEEDNCTVTEILPRKNSFIRPFVANVDCFVIVTAIAKPAPVLQTIDKFLVMAEKAGTDIVVCINKCDLAGGDDAGLKVKSGMHKAAETLKLLEEIYSPIYPVVRLGESQTGADQTQTEAGEMPANAGGTHTGAGKAWPRQNAGLDELRRLIKGKTTALAGASGVGKSTILNQLIPGAMMETGDISRKSQRGKHTTRFSQLFPIDDDTGTMIFDTPGFTSFDILEASEEELQFLYPEIGKHVGKCRYKSCRHIAEPDCAVKEALEIGEIKLSRYESYKAQMEELRK